MHNQTSCEKTHLLSTICHDLQTGKLCSLTISEADKQSSILILAYCVKTGFLWGSTSGINNVDMIHHAR